MAGAASLGPAATPAERPFVPDNPAAALKQWLDNSETVQTLLGIAKDYEALFSAFPVVGFFYGLYTSYQKDRADKERAKEIIRQVVEQISGMIERAKKDIKDHIDDGRLKDRLGQMESNRRKIQFWLETVADSDFANMQDDLAAILIDDCFDSTAALESFLDDAIASKDGAKAAAVYKNLVDAVQLQNQVLTTVDKNAPHDSNSAAARSIGRLLEYHPKVLEAVTATVDTQFFGPVRQVFPPGPPVPDRPVVMLTYYFRGEKKATVAGPVGLVVIDEAAFRAKMATHYEAELALCTKDIIPLEAEHRKALAGLV